MKCGAKRFLAEVEVNGEKKTKTVIARTPAAARKWIRNNTEGCTQIISIREEKRM